MGCASSAQSDGNNAPAASPDAGSASKVTKIGSRYKMGELLGEGGYSQVKLAVDLVTKEKVAVKIVKRVGIDPSDEQALRDEVQILKELDYPNITKLYEFFEEPKSFYVVLEYLEGGELFDRIVKKAFYNEKEARDLVFILLKTIKYLHDKGIVHRDLKPENLLLKSKDNDAEVTLADFGFATYSKGDDITNQCGTPGYIAPEILKCVPYGKTVDMWSFGVILYILLGGYPPFHDENQRALFKKIIKGDYEFHHDYWSGVSDEAKQLIQGLLTVDPKLRLTVDQALAHPWLGKAEELLASTDLQSNLKVLKKYIATRKLKKSVQAIIAVNRMSRLLAGAREAAAEVEKEKVDAEESETRAAAETA